MTNRIVAIILIFICSAIAWAILGGTIFERTKTASNTLNGHVQSTWGSAQVQSPPSATYSMGGLPIQSSLVMVDIAIDYRQKGLLWYSTYKVGFSGSYTFQNPTGTSQGVTFCFPLPAKQAIYDDVRMTANDQPMQLATANGVLIGSTAVAAGEECCAARQLSLPRARYMAVQTRR